MTRPDLVIRAHNVHNGNGRPAEVANAFVSAMHALQVDVGVVIEAQELVHPLRDLARRQDLRLVAEDPLERHPQRPVPEQGDTVLVHRDISTRRTGVAVMTHDWIVRQYQRRHTPRRDPWALYRGPVRGLRGVHLPPGGPDDRTNGAAWCEQMDKALRWAARGGCRVVVGDVNCSRAQLEAYIAAYDGPGARRVHTARVVAGHNVDLLVVVGGTADGEALDHYGSDHCAVLYAVTATGALAAMRRWIKKAVRKLRRR